MRILYLADIRFPLERANGIQSMETCHALAARGHEVTLVVRPDTHTPPRDPFAFYGLPAADHAGHAGQRAAEYAEYAGQGAAERAGHAGQGAAEDAGYAEKGRLRIEVAPITGPAASRRVGYLTFAIGRAMGRTRQDLIFTRDLGLASLLLRIPASLRAPVVYEAHGIAADVAAALPSLLTGAPQASPAKLRRLARREAHVWKEADGYVTITNGLARELNKRFGDRARLAVVPDGARATECAEKPATERTDDTVHVRAAEHAEYAVHGVATERTDGTVRGAATERTDDTVQGVATERTDDTVHVRAAEHAEYAVHGVATERTDGTVRGAATERTDDTVQGVATERTDDTVHVRAAEHAEYAVHGVATERTDDTVQGAATERTDDTVHVKAAEHAEYAVHGVAMERTGDTVQGAATERTDDTVHVKAAEHAEYAVHGVATERTDGTVQGVATGRTDDTGQVKAAEHAEYAGQVEAAEHAEYADRLFTIGYAGHLYPWKGVDLVIEAVAALQDTRALIVGGHEKEPDLARVKAFAAELNCGSRVTFTGLIPPAEVAARLREADVLSLPNPKSAISSEFTSPLKLFEYMASGRPIVASDLPSLREVLRHEENALLVEPGNPQALVAAIQRIKDDPELGRRLAAQALKDVAEFTWARRAERLERLFVDVSASGAPRLRRDQKP